MASRISKFAATLLASALLAGPAMADHGVKRSDRGGANRCRNAGDPAKCEARNAAIGAAEESCKDKAGAEKKGCIENAVCGKAADAERCRRDVDRRIEK